MRSNLPVASETMSTVFSKIIAGDIPGRIVYQDDKVAAFLTIEPVAYGHTLVVPIEEIDKWTDIPADLWAHMNEVAQKVGRVVVDKFDAQRAGYLIAGFEVPHAHIHVFPANDMSGYSLASAMRADETDAAKMDAAADTIREGIKQLEAK
ncbi:Diadenosine tetraphosphate (Ap4A) hydrolase [Corynebacterium coyleae]|nr:HIT-like protein [Corynebacterium coyleae]SEB46024.1 Diadenosine tetraphosphate (Ap4A) hydrolase [Corynebacterium coyleae]